MPLPFERVGQQRDHDAEAEELRKLRESFGLTQVQLAVLLDVSPATYYRWEAAKTPCPFAAIELMRCWRRDQDREQQAKSSARGSRTTRRK